MRVIASSGAWSFTENTSMHIESPYVSNLCTANSDRIDAEVLYIATGDQSDRIAVEVTIKAGEPGESIDSVKARAVAKARELILAAADA